MCYTDYYSTKPHIYINMHTDTGRRYFISNGGSNVRNSTGNPEVCVNLRDKPLHLEHSVLLQHLKIVLLIRSMLVHQEEVLLQFGYYKSQVKLTQDLHLGKHRLTVIQNIKL